MVSLSRPTPFFLLLLHNSLQLPALPPTPPPPHSTLPNPSLPTPSASLSSTPTAASPVVSGASTGSGQYFVHLRLGSPQQPLLLVADTGSDLVCLRCSASKSCSRRLPGSAFLARHSSTFSSFRVLPPPLPKARWFMLATLVSGVVGTAGKGRVSGALQSGVVPSLAFALFWPHHHQPHTVPSDSVCSTLQTGISVSQRKRKECVSS
ncbi:hypothetical protein ACLB2K_016377 [Fragaria x ananassa]